MNVALLLAYLAVCLLLIAIPGPDWAFVLGVGVSHRRVVPAVSGLGLGYLTLTLFVAAGVGAVVSHSVGILDALTGIGAGYLIWTGIGLIRTVSGKVPADAQSSSVPGCGIATVTRVGAGRVLLRGYLVSALNPKALLAFVVLLPQFTDPAVAWPIGWQLSVLGLMWSTCCVLFYLALGYLSGALLRARPSWSGMVPRISGAAMVLVAMGMLVERGVALLGR